MAHAAKVITSIQKLKIYNANVNNTSDGGGRMPHSSP